MEFAELLAVRVESETRHAAEASRAAKIAEGDRARIRELVVQHAPPVPEGWYLSVGPYSFTAVDTTELGGEYKGSKGNVFATKEHFMLNRGKDIPRSVIDALTWMVDNAWEEVFGGD